MISYFRKISQYGMTHMRFMQKDLSSRAYRYLACKNQGITRNDFDTCMRQNVRASLCENLHFELEKNEKTWYTHKRCFSLSTGIILRGIYGLTLSCSFWLMPLVALPADDCPTKLIHLTNGWWQFNISAISWTLSRYWANIITLVSVVPPCLTVPRMLMAFPPKLEKHQLFKRKKLTVCPSQMSHI